VDMGKGVDVVPDRVWAHFRQSSPPENRPLADLCGSGIGTAVGCGEGSGSGGRDRDLQMHDALAYRLQNSLAAAQFLRWGFLWSHLVRFLEQESFRGVGL
jgi:hypothetical protein